MSFFLHNCTYFTFDLTMTLNKKKSGLSSTPILLVIVQGIILVWMPEHLQKMPSGVFVGIRGGRLCHRNIIMCVINFIVESSRLPSEMALL